MFEVVKNGESFSLVAIGIVFASLLYWLFGRDRAKREKEALAALEDLQALGDVVPDTIHPEIDPDRCIGSGACVRACPEKTVLAVVHGRAKLVNPLACVGHSACLPACPVNAIRLVFGTAERGVELPMVDEHFQTRQPGIYVIGELGGMGLIRNAVRQGRQAADHVVSAGARGDGTTYDAVVVGAGPAGISATLRLMEAKRSVILLERETLGGTIMHYPRAKVAMTGALEFALVGTVRQSRIKKEELVTLWHSIVERTGMPIRTDVLVEGAAAEPDGAWRLETSTGHVRARSVLLALGRRGTPRKLGVPGEEQAKVHYRLLEPEAFRGRHVLVVGGGNSAVETALSLADFGACASVSISYRRASFARCRAENRRRIDDLVARGAVRPLLPSEVLRIDARSVVLRSEAGETVVPNDAVIVQIGGTAPAELLHKFGVEMVTKRGEA
jgi:thioredoxin reductase/NAD-dependent dihydropyrimidine dehydrogenase PreA subunit